MRIGFSTASFFKKELTEDALLAIRKLGAPCCEIFLGSFSEYTQKFAKELRKRKGEIDVVSIHSLNQQFEPDLFNKVERARNDSENILKKIARAASIVGARYYTFHGPAMLRRVNYSFDYEDLGKRFEQLCHFVHQNSYNKTILTYENVHWCYSNTPDFFKNLLPNAPSLKTCLDVKQALQSGFSPEKYIEAMGERLTNVHLCDYNNGRTALPGRGTFDFEKLFDDLLSKGYSGDALIEVYSGDYDGYDELAQCYEFLQKCLYRASRAGI